MTWRGPSATSVAWTEDRPFDLRTDCFARSPAIPRSSNAASHFLNSSTDSPYRSQASARLMDPDRTASTTAAFRRATQRFGAGERRNIKTSIDFEGDDRRTLRTIFGGFRWAMSFS